MSPNTCGSSEWNLFYVTLLEINVQKNHRFFKNLRIYGYEYQLVQLC